LEFHKLGVDVWGRPDFRVFIFYFVGMEVVWSGGDGDNFPVSINGFLPYTFEWPRGFVDSGSGFGGGRDEEHFVKVSGNGYAFLLWLATGVNGMEEVDVFDVLPFWGGGEGYVAFKFSDAEFIE